MPDEPTTKGGGEPAGITVRAARRRPGYRFAVAALGGGTLAGGVGHVMREMTSGVEVIGIQPSGAPAIARSWQRGTVVEPDRIDTIADGVAGRRVTTILCGSNVEPADFAPWALEPVPR